MLCRLKRMSIMIALLLSAYFFNIVTAKVTAKQQHCQHEDEYGIITWAYCDDDEECCERDGSAACCEDDENPVCCGESSFIINNWRWLTAAIFTLITVLLICCCVCYCKWKCRRRRQRNDSSSSRLRNSSVRNPTTNPTASPTTNPTTNPTANPTTNPTANPTTNPTTNPTATQTARTVATTPATNRTVEMVETPNCNTSSPRNSDSGSYNLEPTLYSHGDAPPSYYELDLYS